MTFAGFRRYPFWFVRYISVGLQPSIGSFLACLHRRSSVEVVFSCLATKLRRRPSLGWSPRSLRGLDLALPWCLVSPSQYLGLGRNLSFFIPSPCAKGPLAFVQTNRPPTKIILSNKRWLCILIILFYNIILSLFFKINKRLLVCVSYLNLLCQL